jgi:hypothetical protein
MKTTHRPLIDTVAARYALDADLLEAQVIIESSGQADAFRWEEGFYQHYILGKTLPYGDLGPLAACSYGLLQIMFAVAYELGFRGRPEELFVPAVGLDLGAKKLRPHPALRPDSHGFIVGTTELLLAWRYDREGPEAIREVCEQRRACGFNNVRVLWQKDIGNTGHAPWQMPTAKLRPFLGFMESFGFYVQGTILADCAVVNPNEADQQARVVGVRSATVGVSNHIEQLGNEYDKNGHDPHHFSKPV